MLSVGSFGFVSRQCTEYSLAFFSCFCFFGVFFLEFGMFVFAKWLQDELSRNLPHFQNGKHVY